tara:strand:- start:6622 stop:7071 length:450 start_codon:yes stop_codon:yes gene_type:complete
LVIPVETAECLIIVIVLFGSVELSEPPLLESQQTLGFISLNGGCMQIQVNTDRHIPGDDTLTDSIREELQHSLKRFDEHVTRVEVHLSDQNSENRGGADDIRCLIEARIEGHQPNVVTHDAATIKQAFTGATDKMKRVLTTTIERMQSR